MLLGSTIRGQRSLSTFFVFTFGEDPAGNGIPMFWSKSMLLPFA